jgi:hypothetical protein
MEIALFLQQLKIKKEIAETNALLKEQNQVLKEIRAILESKK